MTVDELAQRLHEINVLDMTGNSSKAMKALEELKSDLTGTHLTCMWITGPQEWCLVDTLILDREKED